MSRYERVIQQAKCGSIILMDGATGSEVEQRGVKQIKNAWTGGAALSDPDIVRRIHEDYINCGAKIIISNTFANSKHALLDADMAHNFSALNQAGIRLCVEARDNLSKNDVLVAGGISYWTWTERMPSMKELGNSIAEQANILAIAGADLLMLEMMVDIQKMLIAFNSAKTAGLPVWVGLTCKPNAAGVMCLLSGTELSEALESLIPNKPEVINIMHTDAEYVLPALHITRSHWDGLIGVYANARTKMKSDGSFKDHISPEEYKAFAEEWKGAGVNFIGGCCGVNVEYMTLLGETINKP